MSGVAVAVDLTLVVAAEFMSHPGAAADSSRISITRSRSAIPAQAVRLASFVLCQAQHIPERE